jgi:hypothetical protein
MRKTTKKRSSSYRPADKAGGKMGGMAGKAAKAATKARQSKKQRLGGIMGEIRKTRGK